MVDVRILDASAGISAEEEIGFGGVRCCVVLVLMEEGVSRRSGMDGWLVEVEDLTS